MFNIINISPQWLVFLSALALLLSLAVWLKSRMIERNLTRRITQLERQINIVTSGSIGMGQRVLELESELQNMKRDQADRDASDSTLSYAQASMLFDQGLDAETVASSCGLSLSEASLMELMYQQARNGKMAMA